MKRFHQPFLLWGGFIVASVFIEAVGFYFSSALGVVLLGGCLAAAFALAMGRNVVWLERFENKHQKTAAVLRVLGKVDVLCSLIVLPWIMRAFAVSMGWGNGGIGEAYAVGAAYVIYFIWGALLVSGGIVFIRKNLLNERKK